MVEDAAARNRVLLPGKVVDESGKPVAGATVSTFGIDKDHSVTTAADGSFTLPLDRPPSDYIYAEVVTEGPGDRLGFDIVSQPKLDPVRLEVKPTRALAVRVTDGDGRPVADAEVGFMASMRRLRSGYTDRDGRWIGRVPPDLKNWGVFARKAKAGFDYLMSRNSRDPSAASRPLPEELTLRLTGARTLRVRTIDTDGQPLAGMGIMPWYIHKPGHAEDINLSGVSDLSQPTDDQGIAVLDWLPERIEGQLGIIVRSKDYHDLDHTTWVKPDDPTDEVTITLYPYQRISGRVTFADGRPAAGMLVRASGQGGGRNGSQASARTDDQGRYEMKVHSEQAYLLVAGNDEWASPCRSDLVVRAGKSLDAVDLVLGPATRLHGRVTVGRDNKPVSKASVNVTIDKGQILQELRQPGDQYSHSLQMYLGAQTDAGGRYELHLGPGEYLLRGPSHTKPANLTIPAEHPPTDIVHDFHLERPETGPLAGQVINAQGKPVAGAIVDGAYAAAQVSRWFHEQTTDALGRFSVERSLDPLVLFARSPDGKQGGIVRIDAEAPTVEIRVGPLTTASGRLLDREGNVLAERELTYGIRVYDGPPGKSPWSVRFGGLARTDAEGRFTLTRLVPGEPYEATIKIDATSSRTAVNVTPKDATAIDLAEVKVDPKPTPPYVPPTAKQLTASAFAAGAKVAPVARFKELLVEAGREYTRPLLLFGRPDDPACIELYRLFNERLEGDRKGRARTPAELRWEFELAALDRDNAEVRKLAERLGVLLVPGQVPMLAMLNTDGSLAATFALGLGADSTLDGKPLAAFLAEHKLPTRDAEQMLAEALKEAKATEKRVFFTASASWCGPCRRMTRTLAPFKGGLQNHYVFVKLDISRDSHADAVLKRYQGDREGGVPWYAILDTDGKMLVTSNLPESSPNDPGTNIGCPQGDEAIGHFLGMLKQTASRISADELAELKVAFEKGP